MFEIWCHIYASMCLPITHCQSQVLTQEITFAISPNHHQSSPIITDRTARSYFPFAARPFSSSAPAANLQTCNILRYLATPSIHSILLSLSSASSISSTSISCNTIHPYRPFCQHQHMIIIVGIISTTQPYCPYRQHQHIIIDIVSVIALGSPAPSTSTRPNSSKTQTARQKLTNSYESMGALELQLQPKLHIVVRTKHL